jgi:hypothetical protein
MIEVLLLDELEKVFKNEKLNDNEDIGMVQG